MKALPAEKVPKLDTDGEKYRELQLAYQLPKQDLSLQHCHHVRTERQKSDFEEFLRARNELCLDVGRVVINADLPKKKVNCGKCKKPLEEAGLSVMATRAWPADAMRFHPGCFTCSTCDELLVDLTYCVFRGKVFCARHYSENLKKRCGACDELIFGGEFTKALNKSWHTDHFCCWHCDSVLTGQRFVLTDDHPCCFPCYEQNFTHECQECRGKISMVEATDLAFKDLHWHEQCFKCQKCKQSLVQKPFAAKNTFLFCGSCYDTEFASRCDACGDIFKPGMKKMEYKNRRVKK